MPVKKTKKAAPKKGSPKKPKTAKKNSPQKTPGSTPLRRGRRASVKMKYVKKKKAQTNSKEVDSDIKKDIKKAVDHIPNLIAEELKLSEQKKELQRPKSEIYYGSKPNRSKITMLWIGVILLTAVVFAMWLLNVQSLFYDIENSKASQEEQIWQNAKNDLDDIFIQNNKKEDITDSLKASLNSLLKTLSSASSTTKDTTTSTDKTTSSTEKILTTSTEDII